MTAEDVAPEVYQGLIALGRMWQAQATVLRQGGKRFGAADDLSATEVRDILDVDRLDRMTDRIPDAISWADLLATE